MFFDTSLRVKETIMKKVIERLQEYVSIGNNEDMAFCEEILAENLKKVFYF